MGQGVKAPALPEIQMALLVEDYGPGALGENLSFFDLMKIRQILIVRDVYGIAGTERQKELSAAHWALVRRIDGMAREDGC